MEPAIMGAIIPEIPKEKEYIPKKKPGAKGSILFEKRVDEDTFMMGKEVTKKKAPKESCHTKMRLPEQKTRRIKTPMPMLQTPRVKTNLSENPCF